MTAPASPPDELGRRAASGTSWTLAGQATRTALLVLSTAVLARLLSPDDFGVMAVVTTVVAFGELLYQMGLSTAAARQEHLTRGQQSNLFWINAAAGAVLAVACVAVAPVLATVFDMPELRPALSVVAVSFLLNGVSAQFRAEINRRLDFRALTLVDTLPPFVGFGAAVLLTTVERSPMVLVGQYVVTSAVGCGMALWLGRWRLGLPDRAASVRDILRFGGGLFGTQAVAYLTRNVDNLAIGYVWGAGPLGIYSRAYQLLMAPMAQITAPLTRVYVPVLSRIAADRERHQRYVLLIGTIPGAVMGSCYALAAGAAEPLVRLLFGAQWSAMVPVFQVLAVGGIFRALSQLTFWVNLSLDAAGAQLRFYLWSQPIVVAAMLAGLPWGILGVAVGHSVGYALHWFLGVWQCGRATGFDRRQLLRNGLGSLALLSVPVAALTSWTSTALDGRPWWALVASLGAAGVWAALVMTLTPYGRHLRRRMAAAVRSVRG